MELDDRNKLADLLRRAAAQTIPETEFWVEVKPLFERVEGPVLNVAWESAIHYWGNFHARNIFWIPKKPDRWQLENGRNELNLIAEALESGWELPVLREKLNDI